MFITGLTPYKAGVITSQKGTKQLVLYSSDWKESLQKWDLDAVPSGVTVAGDKIYATVTGDKNGVYVLSVTGDSKEYIPTGSGACFPLADEKTNKLYVCNQFSTTVSEIDLGSNKVMREVKVLRVLIMFPFVIPGAVLGISLIVAFNKEPVILTGTAVIMIIAFVVRKLPYTVRSGSAFLQQMDPSVEEASISLGVSPMQTFVKVTARLMAPGVLSGAILSWITCINELSSSVMLYGGKTSTISVAIYTEVVRNSFGTAAALASILTVSTVISLLIFLKVSKGKVSIV